MLDTYIPKFDTYTLVKVEFENIFWCYQSNKTDLASFLPVISRRSENTHEIPTIPKLQNICYTGRLDRISLWIIITKFSCQVTDTYILVLLLNKFTNPLYPQGNVFVLFTNYRVALFSKDYPINFHAWDIDAWQFKWVYGRRK